MDVWSQIHRVRDYVEARDFAGYDPYDALNSPLLRRIAGGSKWCKIGFTQLLKKCPINVRPLLGIAPGHNPKALGLFLGGYSRLHGLEPEAGHLQRIEHLLELLNLLRSPGYSGNCWGYNFDWQSRTAFRPRGTPTIVNTSFIGHALLDCFELTGNERALQLALPIQGFLLHDLHRTPLDDAFCFSYTPVDREVVHNANMLGASLLIRLANYLPRAGLVDTALASLGFSMRHQRHDGAWYYADTSVQGWIDSFHTGFNLQALRYFLRAGYGDEYREGFERGVRFYAEQFFLDDGTAKYFHDRVYPLDIHAPTQAIAFFSGMGDAYADLTNRILTWMLDHLYDPRGTFVFQQHRWFTNRIPYMRWCQAWAFHALVMYAWHRQETCNDQEDRCDRNCGRIRRPAQCAEFVLAGG